MSNDPERLQLGGRLVWHVLAPAAIGVVTGACVATLVGGVENWALGRLAALPGVVPALFAPAALYFTYLISRFVTRVEKPTTSELYIDNPPEKQFEPQVIRGVPTIPNSVLADGVTLDRLKARETLIDQFDEQLRQVDGQPGLANFDPFQKKAFNLLTSRRVKAAFDLSKTDPRLRERYGRTLFGSSALIARRLVQEGVRFVNVTWDTFWERFKFGYEGWDTHHNTFPIYKNWHLPYFDLTCSALLEDLEAHGLLDETLVVVLSEMGRTPKVNKSAGRDHWTYCYSVFMAGAGLRGGTVFGASDAHAAYVKDRPVSTGDICATIYECLGIDPAMPIHDYSGRPVPVAHGGQPIRDVLV